ncbi:MAG: acyl-CoA dehydrogenase family protein [Pseudomonadota bacterium]
MDFTITEDQQAIRDLAAQIFGDRASDEFLLEFSRTGNTYDDGLWQTLAEQGLLGIAIPEAQGGSGLGLIELCLMLEEQGRTVAPIPLFSSLVLGALPITAFGSEALQSTWLPKLVAGEVKLSAAIAEMNMNPALRVPVRLGKAGDEWVLDGARKSVPDGAVADALIVPGVDEAGAKTLFVVPTDAPGVLVTPVDIGLSGERAAHLTLENVKLSDVHRLGGVGNGGEILAWLEERANVAHCALQTGVTEEAMKRTAAYLGERKQFGVPLGSFQALAMRMADSYIDVEAIRSTYWLALWRLSEGLDARAEVRAAKWWACEAAHRVVCSAQHLHGGIGADVEYPIHRFFLLAKIISYSLGNGSSQLEKLGRLLASDDNLGYHALEV